MFHFYDFLGIFLLSQTRPQPDPNQTKTRPIPDLNQTQTRPKPDPNQTRTRLEPDPNQTFGVNYNLSLFKTVLYSILYRMAGALKHP